MKHMRLIVALAGLALSGCAPKVIVRDRPVTVAKPVPQPCAGTRPPAVVRLKDRYPDDAWAQLDTRQKAAAVGQQLLERQAHGEALDAATGSCP